ncbi:c2H2-type zinc-finger domain-containing protein [Ditylenchus destructor]|nr:c2H2-type zinc-finger domain-containing protein [Ditylenchus destructor]
MAGAMRKKKTKQTKSRDLSQQTDIRANTPIVDINAGTSISNEIFEIKWEPNSEVTEEYYCGTSVEKPAKSATPKRRGKKRRREANHESILVRKQAKRARNLKRYTANVAECPEYRGCYVSPIRKTKRSDAEINIIDSNPSMGSSSNADNSKKPETRQSNNGEAVGTHSIEESCKPNQSPESDLLQSHNQKHIEEKSQEITSKRHMKYAAFKNCSYDEIQDCTLKELYLRTQEVGKKRKCGMCPYVTSDSSHMYRHLRIHTNEKPFKCAHCSYATTQGTALKSHIRIHSGEKPYKCGHCSYASAESCHLRRHMRTHTGEKRYKCDHCSYATTQNCALKRHVRTHNGERTFKCSQCGNAFYDQSNLKRHMRYHS